MNDNKTNALLVTALLLSLLGCQRQEANVEANPIGESPSAMLTLSEENLQRMNLKFEVVRLGSLPMTLKALGRVSNDLNKTAKVTSTLEGQISQLLVDVNDHVKTGDALGLIQSPELLGKPITLRSPLDGVVLDRQGTVGELVSKEREIFTISDLHRVWVIAEVKEQDIAAVKLGQNASFSVLPYPEKTFSGTVTRLGSHIESDSRTLEVRIEADNHEGLLKAGMFADVRITTNVLENALIISDTALQTDEDGLVVFVTPDGKIFDKRRVRTGLEQNEHVQIVEGLSVGEKVVTDGSFVLKSELLKNELGEE